MFEKDEFEKFKENSVNFARSIMEDDGGCEPVLLMHVNKVSAGEKPEKALTIMPIPPGVMDSDESKDKFLEQVMPQLREKFQKEGLTPIYLCFCSEIWLRKAPADNFKIPDNWKDLPKTEGLMLTFEHSQGTEMEVFDMYREGTQLNKNNELVDIVRLEKNAVMSCVKERQKPTMEQGRFANLFVKYFQNL